MALHITLVIYSIFPFFIIIMIQFNAIRDILDREKIKYKYKTYNHLGEWAGSGTLRGNFGSVGNPTSQSIQYEIFVARKDLEKAQAVMWNLLR